MDRVLCTGDSGLCTITAGLSTQGGSLHEVPDYKLSYFFKNGPHGENIPIVECVKDDSNHAHGKAVDQPKPGLFRIVKWSVEADPNNTGGQNTGWVSLAVFTAKSADDPAPVPVANGAASHALAGQVYIG